MEYRQQFLIQLNIPSPTIPPPQKFAKRSVSWDISGRVFTVFDCFCLFMITKTNLYIDQAKENMVLWAFKVKRQPRWWNLHSEHDRLHIGRVLPVPRCWSFPRTNFMFVQDVLVSAIIHSWEQWLTRPSSCATKRCLWRWFFTNIFIANNTIDCNVTGKSWESHLWRSWQWAASSCWPRPSRSWCCRQVDSVTWMWHGLL